MGADHGAKIVIKGASLTLQNNVSYLLCGKKDEIEELLLQYNDLKKCSTVVDTPVIISSNDKPSVALRKRKSSMHCAIEAVKNQQADCAVSAGNTGALMAISRFILGMLANINRPAIITSLPVLKKEIVFLDLGANVDCDGETLYQFALMGEAFARACFYKSEPKVALLNIGSEEVKGTDVVKEAYNLLKNSSYSLNFHGYIEPDKVFDSDIDVVVADGFCGNIMLKTAEGTFELIKNSIIDYHKGSLGYYMKQLLLKYLLKKPLMRFDPKNKNGALLIGLNGVVVKSHGSADSNAFANAIKVAINLVRNKINNQIELGFDNE